MVCSEYFCVFQCDDFVDQYTPAILNLAEHIFDPAYICLVSRALHYDCEVSVLFTKFILGGSKPWNG